MVAVAMEFAASSKSESSAGSSTMVMEADFRMLLDTSVVGGNPMSYCKVCDVFLDTSEMTRCGWWLSVEVEGCVIAERVGDLRTKKL
jgi:hypothetical protein